MNKNVISVIDGEAGSCGKAKVIGEIATDSSIKLGAAVTNCMPNAGHTFVSEKGEKYIFRNIPVSIINPQTELFIAPGSAIDMDVFIKEYQQIEHLLGNRKIYVHEMVPLIEEIHKQYEKEHVKSGSTFKGCGAVTKDKIMRKQQLAFFKSFKNAICCSNEEFMNRLYDHLDASDEYILLEGAQGCDLDLNHSGNYPYVTSRNVSTTQLLADSGISAERLLETIMVIRPFPIRISNITNSGNFIYTGDYGKGSPLIWSQINIAAIKGSYPFVGDLECYNSKMNPIYLKKLLMHSSETSLKQVLGENYRSQKLNMLSLLQAMELERLYYKSKNIYEYNSQIIQFYNSQTIRDLSEETTVTKMERRIFDLDINKLKQNVKINTPYGIYLNFFQHLNIEFEKEKGQFEDYYFNKYLRNYFDWLESETKTEILALGTGAANGEKILKKSLIKK